MGDDLNNINADGTEGIQVLEGVAASALYDYRGGNGAILIAAKSGKKNQSVTVEFNGNLTVNSTYDYRDQQDVYGLELNGTESTGAKTAQEGGSNSWGVMMDGSEVTNSLGSTYKYGPANN